MQKILVRSFSFFFILFGPSTFCIAQGNEVILKTKQNENPRFYEEYYVLKSDTSIKSGIYKKISPTKELLVSGFFKNNKKDSIWIEYHKATKNVISKGFYKNGTKMGLWEYFYPEGILALKQDYSLGKTLFCLPQKDSVYINVNGEKDSEFKNAIPQRRVFFNGDLSQLNAFLLKSITNNSNLNNQKKNRHIEIECIIDFDGKASKQKILNGVSPEMDYEFLNQFKLIPDEWIPAIYNGKPVTSKYIFSFDY